MALSAESLAGPGYIILNIIRAMNIIALLSVVAASVVMLVKTFVVSKFFFFDATTNVVTAFTSLFLIVSECSLFRGYFARNWPLLSPSHGFVFLGAAMIILGLNMLGNMNKEATSQESLGLPFWRLILASGILAIIMGTFNIIASYIFRDSARNITARRVRSHGATSLISNPDLESDPKPLSIITHHTGSSSSRTGTLQQSTYASPIKETSQSRLSTFSPARTFRNMRQSILPSYHSRSDHADIISPISPISPTRSSSMYSRFTSGEPKKNAKKKRDSSVPRMPLQISAPLNVNQQFAHLIQRPDLAHHPSQREDVV